MFDDQTTSRWVAHNQLGVPVQAYARSGARPAAQEAPWSRELSNAFEGAADAERLSWDPDAVRIQSRPELPLWLRALVPAVALFAATLFGLVILFVEPSGQRAREVTPVRVDDAERPQIESRSAAEFVQPAAQPAAAATDEAAHQAEAATASSPPARVQARAPRSGASRRSARSAPVEPSDRRTGMLRINSRPWSQVSVDGRVVGHTPIMALPLEAGAHEVELVNATLGVSKKFRVTIKRDEILTKVVLLVD